MLDVVHSHASKNVLDGLNEFDGTDGWGAIQQKSCGLKNKLRFQFDLSIPGPVDIYSISQYFLRGLQLMMSTPRGEGVSGNEDKVREASNGRLRENADKGEKRVQNSQNLADIINRSPY